MMSLTCLEKVIEVILIVWKQSQLKSAQITLKTMLKNDHCFDHNF